MLTFVVVMAKNFFKSYIWLLETLQSRGPQTLSQLRELWERSAVNEDGRELAPRTFANHVSAIADIFGIDISCDRRDNTYYIENDDDLKSGGIRSWMLDALSMNSLLNESASIRDRIIFEDVPSSHQYLASIIQAIRDSRMLRVHYKGYKMGEDRWFDIEPYFIREHKRRWYLYGHKDYDGERKPHMYALDRMLSVEVLPDSFEMPEGMDAKEWFSGLYGVRKYGDMKASQVLLKVYGKQVRYFRSLPLHASQSEVETHKEYSLFSYNLAPDYDFIQDILSFGDKVEVLEPLSLRREIAGIISRLNEKYNDNGNI